MEKLYAYRMGARYAWGFQKTSAPSAPSAPAMVCRRTRISSALRRTTKYLRPSAHDVVAQHHMVRQVALDVLRRGIHLLPRSPMLLRLLNFSNFLSFFNYFLSHDAKLQNQKAVCKSGSAFVSQHRRVRNNPLPPSLKHFQELPASKTIHVPTFFSG